MAALFGGALFWLVVAVLADWPGAWRATLQLMRAAAVLAALSGFGWEVILVADVGGGLASLLDPALFRAVFFDSPFGPALVVRLVLLTLLPAAVFAPTSDRRRLVATAALAGLLLASQARLGHAAGAGTTPTGVAMMFAYACHALAAAAWVGSLPPLLLILRAARGERGAPILPLLRRVSTLATGAVVVLVAAGTANAAFRLDSLADLATTPYGRVLLAKLGLTAAMLGLAAYNRRAVSTQRREVLLPSVTCELAFGVAVLGVAAILGITPPPK